MNAADFIAAYGGNATANTSGQGALDRALAAGQTYDQIGSLGISFGPSAAQEIGKWRGTFIGKYGGQKGSTGLGALDRALLNNQMTIQDVIDIQKKEGFTFGPSAQEKINKYKDSFTGKFGGSVDQTSTGLPGVMRAMNSGMSINQVLSSGLNFGPKAADFLAQMQLKPPEMPKMPDIKMPTMMNITPSSLGDSGNADGVRINRSERSKRRASNKGTYQLNRKNFSPNSSLLGINLK